MSVRHTKALAALATMLLCTVHSSAQVLPAEQTTRKLVKLSVVAMDSQGAPVTDLAANDFQISDAGKRQDVTLFRNSDGKPQQTTGLDPGEYSNRTSAGVPRATLILFDLLNESFAARNGAQANLIRSLQSLESADNLYFYLLTLDGRLYPVRGMPSAGGEGPPPDGGVRWTSDSKAIEQALNRILGLPHLEINVDTRIAPRSA